ncbi:MAG: M23 family metallopeptidase, partial [Clostridiales Family XIII bacterium]|nr:M23 family metallopeptidase [Clostridiales Family XIII bacterium]
VYIEHGNGTQTVYEHLKEIMVNPADDVLKGQNIAISGNTGTDKNGNPYPQHLHFELLLNVPDYDTAEALGNGAPIYNWPAGTTGYHVNPMLNIK